MSDGDMSGNFRHKAFVVGALAAVCLLADLAIAQDREERVQELLTMENPLEPSDSVWIEELTYLEIRDRIRSGDTTIIIPTGGIENNGPYVVTGKHNVILEALCPAIARKLGNALCAPIVPFVPEGNIDPASGHMLFSGTISVRDETYQALLVDIVNSFKQHGFKDIVLIGGSGGNQEGMEKVATKLNERWADSGTRAYFIGEFYTSAWDEMIEYSKEELGVKETADDGYHDDIWVNALMMVTDPATVRYDARVEAGLASINGVDLRPKERIVELGEKLVDYRAGFTADVIRQRVAASRQ